MTCYIALTLLGEIRACGEVLDADFDRIFPVPDCTIISVSDDDLNRVLPGMMRLYMVDGVILDRVAPPISMSAASIAADGLEEIEVSGIPEGSSMRISGAVTLPWTLIESGVATLTASIPGASSISVRCPPPYLAWSGAFDAI